MNTELAARVAAAAAVLLDFRRFALGEAVSGDWQHWALRLAGMLQLVLEMTELLDAAARSVSEASDAGARLAQIRAVFEVFDWQTDDRQYALEQIEDIALRSTP